MEQLPQTIEVVGETFRAILGAGGGLLLLLLFCQCSDRMVTSQSNSGYSDLPWNSVHNIDIL